MTALALVALLPLCVILSPLRVRSVDYTPTVTWATLTALPDPR